MAIEDRALVALSIAFTASIVAYPDLPPDIPPRAGVDGAFIGAPFVAFFLPVAAAVIWWIVVSLSRHHPLSAAPPAKNVGAATALFLAAFHVATLAGVLGGQPWPGRILGAMVGVFLIATGNQLPRLRPNPVWGIRTRQTLASDDLWRRVHRLGGHLRVLMGVGLCAAALTGMRGFAPLIVVAVAVETVVCIGAAVFLSRRKRVAAGLLAVGCCGIGSAAQAQGVTPGKIDGLPAFIDVEVPKLMARGHVPGAALAAVHNGRIVLLKGYGQSRLDSGAPVDASRTVFRIGSVSKLFAAVAALQLVDAGTLDLQRDIREYLPDVPLRYGVTTHQLLTHVTGLLQRLAGGYTDAAGQLQPLPDHLRRFTPAQVRPPGAYSYSNYNTALTGLVVERLSGRTYADYLAGRIIKPLKMTGTTAYQPPEPHLASDLARGYRWAGGRQVPIAYNYTQTVPAGGVSTTAADMGRLMLMLLGDGSVDGERILTPESVSAMLAPQFTPDPHIPARAYEMTHWVAHGQHLLHKDGTLGDQVAVMLLAPADRFGIFIASNASPEVSMGNQLLEPLLTYFFGPAAPTPPPAPLPDGRARAPRFAGSYRSYSRTRDEMSQLRALMPILQSRVAAEPDGAIRWNGRRWLEVEPLLFRSVDSLDYIVFRENGHGAIVELEAWGGTYERVGWREQAPFQLAVLAICIVAFLAYPLARGLRAIRRRPGAVEGRLARGSAVFVALANLAFVAGLVWSLRDLGAITPLPLPYFLLLSLPIVSVAATALLPAFAARAWRDLWWTRGERLGYSAFAVLAVAFMTFLNYWKLLGIRY